MSIPELITIVTKIKDPVRSSRWDIASWIMQTICSFSETHHQQSVSSGTMPVSDCFWLRRVKSWRYSLFHDIINKIFILINCSDKIMNIQPVSYSSIICIYRKNGEKYEKLWFCSCCLSRPGD